jgi:hypothetical protein
MSLPSSGSKYKPSKKKNSKKQATSTAKRTWKIWPGLGQSEPERNCYRALGLAYIKPHFSFAVYSAFSLILTNFLLGFIFNPEDEGDMFL